MFGVKEFLLCAAIQFSLIGLSIAQKSKYSEHKSSFSVEDVINSVEIFHEKLKYRDSSSRVLYDDEKCAEQLSDFADGLDERDDWALHMFDAWAKIQSGFESGNVNNFGSFDQCLAIEHRYKPGEHGVMRGQHCQIFYGPNATAAAVPRIPGSGIEWTDIARILHERNINRVGSGICVPAACSPAQVEQFAIRLLSTANLELRAFNFVTFCHTNDPLPLTWLDVFAICVFGVAILLLVASTSYEVFMVYRDDAKPNALLISFSAYTNGAKLFDMTKSKSKSAIDCLNGIRALSIIWIIFGHRYELESSFSAINANARMEWQTRVHSVIANLSNIAVDSFFLMGAVLIVFPFLTKLKRNQLSIWNLPRMYLHRYLRITPVLAVCVLVQVSLAHHFGSGPYHSAWIGSNSRNCEEYWWAALLHVQNYVNPSRLCFHHSWYLSVDMQLFWASPLLIYPAYKYGRKFLWSIPVLILLTIGCAFMISYRYGFMAFPRLSGVAFTHYNRVIYLSTHIRMGPWLIGFILAYILYKAHEKNYKMNQVADAVLWLISLSVMCSILFGFLPLQQFENNNSSDWANAFYIAVHRNAWALALAWIVFSCQMGAGGIVRWMLSLPQWQPFARMGLSIYLTHALLQFAHIASRRQPTYFSDWNNIHHFWGDYALTLIISTFFYLAFEAPTLVIESFCYKKFHERIKTTKM